MILHCSQRSMWLPRSWKVLLFWEEGGEGCFGKLEVCLISTLLFYIFLIINFAGHKGNYPYYLNLWFCNSEQEKVKSYRQKISKWQGQVSERLQALGRRAGSYLMLIWIIVLLLLFYEKRKNLIWIFREYLYIFPPFLPPRFRWHIHKQGTFFLVEAQRWSFNLFHLHPKHDYVCQASRFRLCQNFPT